MQRPFVDGNTHLYADLSLNLFFLDKLELTEIKIKVLILFLNQKVYIGNLLGLLTFLCKKNYLYFKIIKVEIAWKSIVQLFTSP